jgi:hypothetical protein
MAILLSLHGSRSGLSGHKKKRATLGAARCFSANLGGVALLLLFLFLLFSQSVDGLVLLIGSAWKERSSVVSWGSVVSYRSVANAADE